MEDFLGKLVRKEFKGFGVFDGVVHSYDSSTGFFKILYKDGDFEELDFSEVARLVSPEGRDSGEIPATAKRVGRKPKKRRGFGCDRGKGLNLAADCTGRGQGETDLGKIGESDLGEKQSDLEEIELGLGGDLGDQGCGNGDLDLNRGLGLDFEDGVERVEMVGGIDLNLTVVNDELDGDVEKMGEEKKERNFDLNLGLSEENLHGVSDNVVGNDLGTGFSEELRNGASVASNVEDARVGDDDVKMERDSPGFMTPGTCEDGPRSGRRKRRRVTRNLTSPTETVLRRSARRAKAVAMNECNSSRVLSMDGANDLSMSGVTEESEEKPCDDVDLGRTREKPWVLPARIELPPSSTNLNLEGIPVLDLFFVYSCLRSFSTLLYLSPFELEDLVAALKSRASNLLIDFIHVSILQTLRKHLEFLASEGSESASTCLRNMNWDLLDVITWPVFMVEYLLIHGSGLKPGFSIERLNLFDGEYYTQPASVKLELLRCLCDDVIEVEATRSELNKRMVMTDLALEMDRQMTSDLYKKRRVSSGARVDTSFSEDIAEEDVDGNSDECCLCKMDGNLICCDGCPAAYHTKCVGIVSNLLPEGEWHCPECTVAKSGLDMKPQRLIRGAELLGIDAYGRLFFSCFNYLLVSDSYDAESSFTYYHKNDLGAIVQLLRSYDVFYQPILSAISQQWGVSTDFHEPKTSSEGSGEVLQSNELTPNSPKPGSTETPDHQTSKKRKRNRTSAPKSSPKTKEEDDQRNPEDVYTNCYSFARTASLVVDELLRKPSDRENVEPPKTEEEIISIQSKFIWRKSTRSCWPSIQDRDVNRHKEKCGWCYCCRFPMEGRECLFSSVNKSYVAGGPRSELGDLLLVEKSKKGHLVDVICCLLYMEQRLRGLLSGPWLGANYSELWRRSVLQATDISALKRPLLALESNLHPMALSADWLKLVDSAPTMGSASHFVASLRAISKNGIGKRKIRCGDSEIKALVAAGGLGLFWWRGGKVSRSLFNWKVLPQSLALKAARNAGRIKVPGIQYPDGSEGPKRSRCIAWRAAVETSTSVEQLALQVRELDMFLRWHDIENTHHQSVLDKESLKSIRLFKKSIVRRKCVEGTLVKYLVDFGKRRCVPDVVTKHGTKVEDPSGEKKKYWLEEAYVPLHLLRGFGERRIARKASKPNCRKSEKSVVKPSREKGFDYLFSRAERVDSHQCGHCNKDVPISEAVSCQYCNGYFHKRHATRSSGAIASESTYTCHRCRASNHVKNDSIPGKRKVGKLRGVKTFKVETRGRLGKLRGKARGNGKSSSSTGIVLSGKNTKKRGRGRPRKNNSSSLQENNVNVYSGMTLRRSARQAACKPVQPKKTSAGAKKKKKRNNYNNKAKKVAAAKEATPKSTCRKRSIRAVDSAWVNGLLLSKKPEDERVVEFKRRKLLVPSDELSAGVDDSPKCSLCSEQGFVPSKVYIACDACGDWFHGDAFGVNEGNMELLIGFKCHGCREMSPPVCPFHGISRNTNEVGTPNAQGSSEEVFPQKETDCVLEMDSNEVPPARENPVENFEPKDSSATHVDHDIIAPTLDSELGEENGTSESPRKVISNAIETRSGNGPDLSADCELESHSNDVSLASSDHVKTSIVDPEIIVENGSSASKEDEVNITDCQNGSLNPGSLTEHGQESSCDGISPGCSEVPSVQNSVVNLDPVLGSQVVKCDAIESLKEYLNADELSEETKEDG